MNTAIEGPLLTDIDFVRILVILKEKIDILFHFNLDSCNPVLFEDCYCYFSLVVKVLGERDGFG